MTQANRIQISLSSGIEIVAQEIFLYWEDEVQKIGQLRADAEEELRGFSTGVGFLGSPGWVLGSALVLGAIESRISDDKAKRGLSHLKKAVEIERNLQASGVWCEIASVAGIEKPDPAGWSSTCQITVAYNLNEFTSEERSTFYSKRGIEMSRARRIMSDEGGTYTAEESRTYVHNGQSFVRIKENGFEKHIRWELVASYSAAL